MDAAETLRDARRRAGLSQRALAQRARTPQPTIARIESHAVVPRVDTLDRASGSDSRLEKGATSIASSREQPDDEAGRL